MRVKRKWHAKSVCGLFCWSHLYSLYLLRRAVRTGFKGGDKVCVNWRLSVCEKDLSSRQVLKHVEQLYSFLHTVHRLEGRSDQILDHHLQIFHFSTEAKNTHTNTDRHTTTTKKWAELYRHKSVPSIQRQSPAHTHSGGWYWFGCSQYAETLWNTCPRHKHSCLSWQQHPNLTTRLGPNPSWPYNHPSHIHSGSSTPVSCVFWAFWPKMAAIASSRWMLHIGVGWADSPLPCKSLWALRKNIIIDSVEIRGEIALE